MAEIVCPACLGKGTGQDGKRCDECGGTGMKNDGKGAEK